MIENLNDFLGFNTLRLLQIIEETLEVRELRSEYAITILTKV